MATPFVAIDGYSVAATLFGPTQSAGQLGVKSRQNVQMVRYDAHDRFGREAGMPKSERSPEGPLVRRDLLVEDLWPYWDSGVLGILCLA